MSVMRKTFCAGLLFVVVLACACTLPQTDVMRKLGEPAPVCRTLEDWNVYRAAYDQTPRDGRLIAQLEASGACVVVPGGTVIKKISLGTRLQPDEIAIQLEAWEQTDGQRPLSGITWRSNIVEWKFRQAGGFWKFWK